MAGVIRWKMVCSKQHGRAPSGRLQGAGASTPRDSLSVTTPGRCRHHYYYLHIGCLGEHSRSRSFMHVVPKVHSDDVDGSCSSQVTDEHGETLSDASQRKEGSQLAVLRCYFCKLNSGTAHKPYSFDHRKDDEKAGPSSTKVEEADVPGDDYGNFKKTSDSLEVHFNRRDAGAKGYLNTAADDYTADYLIFDEKTLFLDMQTDDQTSSFCLTNLLAAINIAVLLFEIASPGPVFALIGAWLVYQSQNKDAVDKNVSETMFRQAVVATALSFLLSSFGRIDNWTHLGAMVSGILFGYLTCPSVQLDAAAAAAKKDQKEAVILVRRQASPCKSIAIFSISIAGLALFAFAYGTQA